MGAHEKTEGFRPTAEKYMRTQWLNQLSSDFLRQSKSPTNYSSERRRRLMLMARVVLM